MAKNENKIILDLCGGTGAWSRPYKEAGYTVHVITYPDYSVHDDGWSIDSKNLYFYHRTSNEDLEIPLHQIYGVLAAPPCTMFSMARTNAKTPRDLESAMVTVQGCLQIVWGIQTRTQQRLAFWALENPKARLRWFLGQPAMTFNPYDFGDAYRKPTDLWGNFNTDLRRTPVELDDTKRKQSQQNLQELQPIPEDYKRDPNMSLRAIARSITHKGFAEAFFKANR